jgi:hypothetical protein
MMKLHFREGPGLRSVDNYKNYSAYIPLDEAIRTTFTRKTSKRR